MNQATQSSDMRQRTSATVLALLVIACFVCVAVVEYNQLPLEREVIRSVILGEGALTLLLVVGICRAYRTEE